MRRTAFITTNGSRNWFECGAHTKMTGQPSGGTLNWLRAPISRKKMSITEMRNEATTRFGETLPTTHAITQPSETQSTSSGSRPSGGSVAAAAIASQISQPQRYVERVAAPLTLRSATTVRAVAWRCGASVPQAAELERRLGWDGWPWSLGRWLNARAWRNSRNSRREHG